MGEKNLIMASYTKEEYRNQTTLHVAVANGNLKVIEMLLKALDKKERKKLMNTVADGIYFRKEHPEGQLCLSAAAWSKNPKSLILLARYGASFATSNLDGNTLLHNIVLSSAESCNVTFYQNKINMVYEAVGEWAKHCTYDTFISDQLKLEQHQRQVITFHKLLELQNKDGFTPLILATKLGSPLMLSLMNMENIYKIPQSKLGSVAWVTYDVTDVSTFALGAYNKFSMLHVLAHESNLNWRSTQENGESTLDTEPLKSLIEKKWSIYRWIYIAWFFIHLIYMTVLTVFTSDAAPNLVNFTEIYHTTNTHDDHDHTPKYQMAAFAVLPVIYILLECLDWLGSYPYSFQLMHSQSFFSKLKTRGESEWVIYGNGPYRFVLIAHSLLLLFYIFRHLHGHPLQVVDLSMALLFGWIFLLFFTRGCRFTSRFSIMIQKLFFQDLMYFMAVFGMILVSFTFSVSALYSNLRGTEFSPGVLFYIMLNVVIEIEEKGDEPPSAFPYFTKVMLVLYSIMAVILMLNMLIAMMNTSYEEVRETKENIVKQQKLSIMLMLERRLFWWRSLCMKSEGNIWHKNWDDTTRAYIDVTTTSSFN